MTFLVENENKTNNRDNIKKCPKGKWAQHMLIWPHASFGHGNAQGPAFHLSAWLAVRKEMGLFPVSPPLNLKAICLSQPFQG